MKRIAIVGGGAAGCFCAVNLARLLPGAEVLVFEAGPRPMAKLSLTGGGRCNLTNTFEDCDDLSRVYPRGARLMSRLLHEFGSADTQAWFSREGVALKTEAGGRVFPVSDDALEVVGALERAMREACVRVTVSHPVRSLDELEGFDAVVLAAGGKAASGLLGSLGFETVPPVPSLFAFDLQENCFSGLAGVGVNGVSLRLNCGGRVFRSGGDMLFTHRGISGPAVLKLSSYAARALADCGYRAPLSVNYLSLSAQEAVNRLRLVADENRSRLLVSAHPGSLPSRLWKVLAGRAGIREDCRWAEAGSRSIYRLAELLTADTVTISGRTANKDEFVTCGGVPLDGISARTLSAKNNPSLYFAGEVLDIDAVTGGFNLQAAWTTGYVAARSVALRFQSPAPEF